MYCVGLRFKLHILGLLSWARVYYVGFMLFLDSVLWRFLDLRCCWHYCVSIPLLKISSNLIQNLDLIYLQKQ